MEEARAALLIVEVIWILAAVGTFVVLLFISAPYGRHTRPGWGPALPARLGWMVMEIASPLIFSFFLFSSDSSPGPVVLLFWALWVAHYGNRAVVYPLRLAAGRRPMAAAVIALGVLFNGVNGFINGRHLGLFAARYTVEWLADPRFVVGLFLFLAGGWINLRSDAVLRRLRSSGGGYAVPRGGLFERVSSPNYFGEIVEWTGWACLTGSLAGLTFAVWTAANLVPRALAHHRWYRETFPDYPNERRAIIPYLL